MNETKSLYHGHRFPAAVISHAVRWYFQFPLGLRGKARVRVNNRTENSHCPTRERERRMQGFRDPKCTQVFRPNLGPIRQHFAIKRHLLRTVRYRKQLATQFKAWRLSTCLIQNPSAF
ncbi:transposase [Burkholderia oklahomensis]|uniref:transposase n=1 Tax=Burkholderia oklahomensis TaxID=342113 RepID=UPI0009DA797C|nr:transposase [Burkholderia oklahomensis]QPS41806.1 transposase [Burkholderia oklahomensis]